MTDTCDTRAQMNDSSRNSFTESRHLDGDKCTHYDITIYYYVTKMICLSPVNCSRVYLPFVYSCTHFVLDNYIIYYSTFFSCTKVSVFLCADSGCQSSQNLPCYRYIDLLTFLQRASFIVYYYKVLYVHSNVLNWHIFTFSHIYWTYQISPWNLYNINIVLLGRYWLLALS